jgi:two-component system, cell cycle sensor histidine kinase and response regulator CckA
MMVDSGFPLLHDLNNQLTLIMGCAANLADLLPQGEAETRVSELRVCAERASQIARQLLTKADYPVAPRLAIDLNVVLAPLGKLLARAGSANHIVRVRLSSEPAPVLARVPELERVVVNLVLNAFDALSGPGMVTIETVVVGAAVRLTIRDTGSGMPAEVKQRLFEPPFTTKPTGVGLGMASVAFTVRELRGTMAVDSTPDQGTTVTVVLPLRSDRPSLLSRHP